MAATRIIEEDRGIYVGTPRHPHQGYYAGDFTGRSPRPAASSRLGYGGHPSSERMLEPRVLHGAPRGGRWNS